MTLDEMLAAFHDRIPDATNPAQRIAFGTSGHRGAAERTTFNEAHVVAITQAVCDYRRAASIDGPLFLGMDTHALSAPALDCALEVLAANGVDVLLSDESEYCPTPAISHAILQYNRGRTTGLADGIVLSPSHNPPTDGGLKYNPPHGGPADSQVTSVIEANANRLLEAGNASARRISRAQALASSTTRRAPILANYVSDLANVIDFDIIRQSGIRMGVDPLGGAGVHYWPRIAEQYRIDLTVIRTTVDKTFSFMSLDWDGKIRMDPSSAHAMRPVIEQRANFDIAFACDTDHDRHGIVTPDGGLVPSNHYLAVAIDYLLDNRPQWRPDIAIGKTLVSSSMIDRVVAGHRRSLVEVPVGFKWFVDGLMSGALGFVGEESAGATFLRRDGTVWTTDKDGITAGLLSAEITARTGHTPTAHYVRLENQYGVAMSTRIDSHATLEQKRRLSALNASDVKQSHLAGETISSVLTHAPGNGAAIGGIKVVTPNAWFAARPSGTEDIYKVYAETFLGPAHLEAVVKEAVALVNSSL
jgi:phosphoglucomutase